MKNTSYAIFDGFFDGFFQNFSCRTTHHNFARKPENGENGSYFCRIHHLPDRLKFVNNIRNYCVEQGSQERYTVRTHVLVVLLIGCFWIYLRKTGMYEVWALLVLLEKHYSYL